MGLVVLVAGYGLNRFGVYWMISVHGILFQRLKQSIPLDHDLFNTRVLASATGMVL